MKLLEKFKNIKLPEISLGRGVKTALSVYITPEVLRILELNSERRPVFQPVEHIWEGKRDEEKLAILKEYIQRYNLKGKTAHTCITAKNGILKIQKYPTSLPKKDLDEAIRTFIQVEKENLREDSIADYFLWESDDGNYRIVALVIVRKLVYEKLKEIIEKSGLKLGIVDFEVTAIVNGGLEFNLKKPFAILYVDYHESVFVYYTGTSIVYNILSFSMKDYMENKDELMLQDFLIEVRNILTVNEVTAIYLAGKVIEDSDLLDILMTNLPILSLLEPENLKASFFIPYTLCVRGIEGK